MVALELAAAHPDRVTGLALIDPGGDTSDEPAAAVEAALEAVTGDPRQEFALHYREFLHGARPATARRVLADLAATAVEALLQGFGEAIDTGAGGSPQTGRACWRGPLNDLTVVSRPCRPRRRVMAPSSTGCCRPPTKTQRPLGAGQTAALTAR